MRIYVLCVLLTVLSGPGRSAYAQQGELIDRTLAIVGGQAVTLSDVQIAMALGLVEANTTAAAAERLVDRVLILREVQRYAPPEPPEAASQARLNRIGERFDDPEQLERVLSAGGFSHPRLRDWIRNDLRIEAYLSQRFAAGGTAAADLVADWVADLRRRTVVIELWRP